MTRLRELLDDAAPQMRAIESHLDGLGAENRIAEIRSLGRAHQSRLFDAASGHRNISLHDIVPADREPMDEVVHDGKNSLPAFNLFAKAFVRPPAEANELWGYNRTGGFIETIVGPGYFVAYPHEVQGEILIDYRRIPPERPNHWPALLPNSARLSKLVYADTQDVLRGVSRHVSIGRAIKAGKPMSAWFVLCRRVQPETRA